MTAKDFTMKKNKEEKREYNLTSAFFNAKNKASAACMAAFLLAGGLIFVFLAIMGEKDLRKDDIKFSYGNVLRGAFSPIEDFFTGKDKAAKTEQIARARMHNRGAVFADEAVSLNDWLDAPAEGSLSSSGRSSGASGPSTKSKTDGKRNPGENAQYKKMEAALGSAFASSSGGTSKTTAQISSFSNDSVSKSAINTDGGTISKNRDSNGKGEKPSAKQTLQEARQDLSAALKSGSAAVAKTNWGSKFDGSTTSAFNSGKKTEMGKNSSAYADKGLVKLDEIKSGEIENLKTDGKTSIPEASVPKMDESSSQNRTSTDLLKDTLGSLTNTLGDSISSGIKGKKSDNKKEEKGKSDKNDADANPMSNDEISMASVPGAKNEPPENIRNVMENTRSSNDHSEFLGEGNAITYEDTKVTYNQNEDGSWTVTYEGKYAMIDTSKGERTEEGTYKDTFKIGPDGKKADLVGIVQNDQTLYDEINPPANQLPPATITAPAPSVI